ncbi:MAG: cytosine permease [Planctomycetaceae bacterium]|nr:cytosine permease [Planctomycetaceae bacterium]
MAHANEDKEFSRDAVPLDQRRGFFSLLVVVLGLVFVVTSMQVGGIIGNGLPFNEAIGAVVLSSVILTVLGAFMGVIGAKTGLTFGLLTRYSFGELGTWIPVAIVTVTTIGWFSIDAFLIGASTNSLFASIPIWPIVILSGVGMTVTALYGIGWMTKLSNLAVPLIALFAIISIVYSFVSVGGIAGFQAIVPASPITFSQGVSLGVGSYAVGAIMFTPDILRFAKSKGSAIYIMTIAMMIGNTFVVLFGTIGALATGEYDIANILRLQGLLAPAFLVLVLNIWSTAQGCVYTGSLSLSSRIGSVKREHIVVGFGVVGIIMALLGFYDHFGNYINFLASLVPTLAGVLISDYFIKYRAGYSNVATTRFAPVDITGFAAWLAGILVYYYLPLGMPAVTGVVASFLARTVLVILSKKQGVQA